MSITLYTGSPGSGKSLDCTEKIIFNLENGVNVISNYDISIDHKKIKGKLYVKTDEEITVNYLINFAKKNHIKGKENQTLIVLDEAQLKFNSRAWQDKSRVAWNKFFTVHRHLGYEIILATQKDTFLDSQLRGLIEYEVIHKNIKKSKLGLIFPFMPNWFVSITYWYQSRMKVNVRYFLLKKKVIAAYDSYIMFDKIIQELNSI